MTLRISGPAMAPAWSIASCRPKPHPSPVWLLACESIASRAGERMALPIRSAIMRERPDSQRPVSASGRHREQVEDVADNGGQPISAGAIADVAGNQPNGIADQLAETGDDPDDGCGRAEQGQIGAGDAPRALVRHVGEQADDAEQNDEAKGAPPGQLHDAGGRGFCVQTSLLPRATRQRASARQAQKNPPLGWVIGQLPPRPYTQ